MRYQIVGRKTDYFIFPQIPAPAFHGSIAMIKNIFSVAFDEFIVY